MLIKSDVRITKKDGCINNTIYQCDMCKKTLKNTEKYTVGVTEIGRGSYHKKWDICDKCLSVIEKNVKIWHLRLDRKVK